MTYTDEIEPRVVTAVPLDVSTSQQSGQVRRGVTATRRSCKAHDRMYSEVRGLSESRSISELVSEYITHPASLYIRSRNLGI